MTDHVTPALRRYLGRAVGIGLMDPRTPAPPLWDTERPAMARAIPKRVQEFAAGRAAARAAMTDLGLPAAEVPMGGDRAPQWPKGLVGSIAHCDTLCVAVVSQSHTSLGIDVEPNTPLEPDLWDIVCTPQERTWVEAQPSPGHAAKQVFCAKEAVYKAQYPLTGRMLEFSEVTLTPHTYETGTKQQFTVVISSLTQGNTQVFATDNLLVAACAYALSNRQATSSTKRASRT